MYKTYRENKANYLGLKQFDNKMVGGTNDNSAPEMLTRRDITSFKLSELIGNINKSKLIFDKITKIGSFEVKDKVVIGDTHYETLNLLPGIYTAYFLADSLMIINDKLKIIPDILDVQNWTWKSLNKRITVHNGQFGFYDLNTIEFINKKLYAKDNCAYNKDSIPTLSIKGKINNVEASLIDGSCIFPNYESGKLQGNVCLLTVSKTKKIDDEIIRLGTFGVAATTGTGDGNFECFVIDNERAILIGGQTNEALYS